MITSYEEAKEYILSIPKFTQKNTWERTRDFYEFLGKPGKASRIIHVAGTNGKGSVCAYMDSCLKAGGVSVGMFTSPHLVNIRERIRLNQEWINEEDFLTTFHRLEKELQEYRRKSSFSETAGEDYHPTFFEWMFFLCMLYFQEKQPEVILLETGLGGKLDATNVIDAPKVAVITSIGMDHTQYLGNTLEEIAGEKAGIIKPGSRVVYAAMNPSVEAIMKKKTEECGCLSRRVSKPAKTSLDLGNKRIDFSFTSRYYGYIPICLSTIAGYQTKNAALALASLEEAGLILKPHQLKEGLAGCRWEGRMEEVLPGVVLDGAHNREGIEAFLETVAMDGCGGKRWLLFSVVQDKEAQVMAAAIKESGLFEYIQAVPLENKRGLSKEKLRSLFGHWQIRVGEDVPTALKELLGLRKQEDIVYVAGSLYLVGQVKEFLATEELRC